MIQIGKFFFLFAELLSEAVSRPCILSCSRISPPFCSGIFRGLISPAPAILLLVPRTTLWRRGYHFQTSPPHLRNRDSAPLSFPPPSNLGAASRLSRCLSSGRLTFLLPPQRFFLRNDSLLFEKRSFSFMGPTPPATPFTQFRPFFLSA